MTALSKYVSWRNISDQDTVSFLHNPIHDPNVEAYRNKQTNNWQEDAAKAKKLQGYLKDIKNYAQTRSVSEGNHLQKAELELLFDNLQNIRGVRGQTANQAFDVFRKAERSGTTNHAFEQDMADINIAVMQALSDQNYQSKRWNIMLGQSKVNWDLTEDEIAQQVVQRGLQAVKTGTIRKLENLKQKSIRNDGNFYTLVAVDGKIDMASQSVQVTETVRSQYAHLAELNDLFKDATFTLKNYTNKSYRTKLGSTNIFRVVYTLTQQFTGMSNDYTLAYTSALAIRHATDTSVEADIDSHLGHLQRIYELTGLGQEYVNIEQKEVRDLLKQGAKFMIENVYNNDEIHVASTKELLYIMLNTQGSDHFSKTVKMARSIFQKIEAANSGA